MPVEALPLPFEVPVTIAVLLVCETESGPAMTLVDSGTFETGTVLGSAWRDNEKAE